MRFLKKFTDWKVWLFIILPIVMIIAYIATGIYIYVNSVYNIALIIVTLALFPAACFLTFICPHDRRINQKHPWRSAASIAFMLCFLVLQITFIVMTPDLVSTYQEEQQLYQALQETSSDDEEFSERLHDWSSANKKTNNARSTWQFVFYGSLWALTLSSLCAPKGKHDTDESKDNSKKMQE